VEDHVCLTGAEDGHVRLWNLRSVGEDDGWGGVNLAAVAEEGADEEFAEKLNGIRSSTESIVEQDDPCARLLQGHSKAVTSLYFEDDCLVSWMLTY
jgi:division protein 1